MTTHPPLVVPTPLACCWYPMCPSAQFSNSIALRWWDPAFDPKMACLGPPPASATPSHPSAASWPPSIRLHLLCTAAVREGIRPIHYSPRWHWIGDMNSYVRGRVCGTHLCTNEHQKNCPYAQRSPCPTPMKISGGLYLYRGGRGWHDMPRHTHDKKVYQPYTH